MGAGRKIPELSLPPASVSTVIVLIILESGRVLQLQAPNCPEITLSQQPQKRHIFIPTGLLPGYAESESHGMPAQ